MTQLTVQQAFDSALRHHRAGRLQEAEQLYRLVLSQQPEHVQAIYQLGAIAYQTGRDDIAVDFIRRALLLNPNWPEAHSNLGNALKRNGRLDEAIAAHRQAIALNPNLPGAYNNLGNVLKERNQFDEAIAAYRHALVLRPNYVEALCNLGLAWAARGQFDEAIAAYRQAIVLKPNYAEAHNNLGNALADKGQIDEAITVYRQAIAFVPNYADAYSNLGSALTERSQLDEAITACQQAIALAPNFPEAYNNLGIALARKRRFDEAIAILHQALALRPNYAQAFSNLGIALADKGQLDQAIAVDRQAIILDPNLPEAYNNLGNSLKQKGQLDEAITAYRQAIALRPGYAQAYSNLGNTLAAMGQLDEAIIAYRQAITLRPTYASGHSNLLLALHYHPACDSQAIVEEHRRWNHQHAQPLEKFIHPHNNDRDPTRRLKVGYVSPDFCEHPVGRFLMPLLEQHDHARFEICCYSSLVRPDEITARLRSHADHWRDIAGLNDEQAAAQIHEDQIDILVDLAGHTAGNRLLIFARKPAPVQVSYLGYPGTTGLSAIDYRLTDSFADPAGLTEHLHTETLYRLPQTNWCFAEPGDSPPVEPPPSIRQGHMTFGSFNNFAKVTPQMIHAWGRILLQVPNSRLLLKAAALATPDICLHILENFAAQGIAAGRLDLRPTTPDYSAHLASYSEMDIALDTFPYHGTTTTCDALWMGVPVITLAGQSHVSRVSLSLLSNVGLPELVATTVEEYVSIAVSLAQDEDRLKTLRLSLRQRMRASPLMDAPNFTRDIETAYRQMWRTWCEPVSRKT